MLIKEYFENSLQPLDFCISLEKCLHTLIESMSLQVRAQMCEISPYACLVLINTSSRANHVAQTLFPVDHLTKMIIDKLCI